MAKKNKVLAFGIEPTYRRYRLRCARYYALAQTVSAYLGKRPADEEINLLDVGSGRGRTKRYLDAMNVAQKINYFGMDLSSAYQEKIYDKEKWHLLQSNLEQGIPLESEQFDVVVCEQVLEHLKDPHFALSELARVLREDGLLVVGVPIFPPLLYRVRKHLVPVIDRFTKTERSHIQTFSAGSITKQIRNLTDMEIQETRGVRVLSGGILSFLEDYRPWWKLNSFMGRIFPCMAIEVQVIARKKGAQ